MLKILVFTVTLFIFAYSGPSSCVTSRGLRAVLEVEDNEEVLANVLRGGGGGGRGGGGGHGGGGHGGGGHGGGGHGGGLGGHGHRDLGRDLGRSPDGAENFQNSEGDQFKVYTSVDGKRLVEKVTDCTSNIFCSQTCSQLDSKFQSCTESLVFELYNTTLDTSKQQVELNGENVLANVLRGGGGGGHGGPGAGVGHHMSQPHHHGGGGGPQDDELRHHKGAHPHHHGKSIKKKLKKMHKKLKKLKRKFYYTSSQLRETVGQVFFDGCFMKSNSNKHAGYIKLFNEEKKNNPNRNYVMFIENLKVKTLTLSIDCLQAFKENIDKLFAINLNKQLIYYAKLQNITEGTFQGFKDKLVQWVTENRIEIFKQCPCSVYDQFQKTEPLLYLKLKTSLYDSCSIKCNLKVNYSGSSSKKSTKQDDQVTSVKKKQDKLEKSEEKSSSDEKKISQKK